MLVLLFHLSVVAIEGFGVVTTHRVILYTLIDVFVSLTAVFVIFDVFLNK